MLKRQPVPSMVGESLRGGGRPPESCGSRLRRTAISASEGCVGSIIGIGIDVFWNLEDSTAGTEERQERVGGNEIQSQRTPISVDNQIHQVSEGHGIGGLAWPEINSQ